jgi:hypothetical protein
MTTEDKIKVMQAHLDGAKIEVRDRNTYDPWRLAITPVWDWYHYEYRVKPEPREFYINIYAGHTGYPYPTKDAADKDSEHNNRLECIHVREVIE